MVKISLLRSLGTVEGLLPRIANVEVTTTRRVPLRWWRSWWENVTSGTLDQSRTGEVAWRSFYTRLTYL